MPRSSATRVVTGSRWKWDGAFPLIDIIHAIDGRSVIRAHGNPMPVLGRRFEAELGADRVPHPGETVVRMRVLELALCLRSIQEQSP